MKKTITILFTETKGWYDKAIRFLTRSKYSHASLSVDGVNFYSFNYHGFCEEHPHHMKRKCQNLSISIEVSMSEYRRIQMGIYRFKHRKEKYKYTVLGVIFCLMHIPHKFKDKYFCSQFVAEMLESSGVVELDKRPSQYTPKKLMCKVQNISNKMQLINNAF